MSTKRWILIAAVLGSGIVFLDSTVVNVALPKIGRDLPRLFLGVLEGQSYVYNAYLLTLSALLILAGAVNDFYGRKRTFLLGLVGFGATSVLCGFAPKMELLVLFRVLQGATGALLVPGSLALITANFSGQEQARAFGTIYGQQRAWRDPLGYLILAAGIVATAALPWWMMRAKHPLIPLDLFRSRNFTVTNISTLLIYGALYVTFYYLGLFQQGTLG